MLEQISKRPTGAYQRVKSFFNRHPGIFKTITSAVLILVIYYGVRQIVAVVTAPRISMTMNPLAGATAVTVQTAKLGNIESAVTYTGTVVPYEVVQVSPRVAGWLENIRVDVGDKVKKGQVMVSLDKTELRAEMEAIRARRIDAQKELARDQTLVKAGAISQSEYDVQNADYGSLTAQEQAAETKLSYTDIIAPITGEVIDRIKLINFGELVQPGEVLLTLADLRRVRVQVNVAEPDAPKIRIGTPVVVHFPDLSPSYHDINARVTAIFPQMDPITRTTKVEILVSNPSGLIRPDMYNTVDFILERADKTIVLARRAVIPINGQPTVFTTDGVAATAQPVKTGIVAPDRIQILSGVKAGQMVIVDGNRTLTDGQQINIVSSM